MFVTQVKLNNNTNHAFFMLTFRPNLIGFTGYYCETQIDQCQSNPCLNGGICRTLINSFKCDCPQGYTVREHF